jgi:hypothetical protein
VAKAEPKPKALKFLPSTFAAAVARSAAELRPAMDFMEEKVSALPETLELVSKGEKLGWDRATMLNLTLSVRALAIDPEREGNELTIEVFKSCGLDPKKPLHWRALLSAMIDIGFKNGGAPREWDELRYFDLFSDIKKLQETDRSYKSKEGIANGLRKRKPFDRKYGDWKVGYLRRKVSEAQEMFTGIAPGATFEQFVAERRAKEFGLPVAVVREYVDTAWASIVAEARSDPDATLAMLEEAERQAAHKRRDMSRLPLPKKNDP